MSPQCSEDYRTRRPVSRSNTWQDLSEQEKARKKRSYELWKIDRERDRLHEERKKRLIEKYNQEKRMSRHGRTGSQKEDNPRSPDLAENRPTDEEIRRAGEVTLRILTNAELQQLVARGGPSTSGTNPPPRPAQAPSTSGSRRPARSPPRRYDGDGSHRRSGSHPRPTEGRSTSRNRIRSRSPRGSRSRQRRTGGSPTSRNRTRSRSPPRHDSRGDGSLPETTSYRTRSEAPSTSERSIHSRSTERLTATGDGSLPETTSYRTRSEAPSTSERSIHSRSTERLTATGDHRRRSEAPSTSGGRRDSSSTQIQNPRGPRDEERRTQGRNEPEEYRLRRQLHKDIGQCTHTTDLTRVLPCPLDPEYCSHSHIMNCACHRCPRCQYFISACTCNRRRRSLPTTAPAPPRVTPPVPRQVTPPEPRPVPPQVPREPRRPPSPEEYPLPSYLRPLPPGRIYLYFPMGPLPAHYIATTRGSPLHNWWQRYRNTPYPGAPPIPIPFLQLNFTPEHIPPRPQNLGFGNIWVPPPRPPGPYYHGGPPAYPWSNPNFRHY